MTKQPKTPRWLRILADRRLLAWAVGSFMLSSAGCTHKRGECCDDEFSHRSAAVECISRKPIFVCTAPQEITVPPSAVAPAAVPLPVPAPPPAEIKALPLSVIRFPAIPALMTETPDESKATEQLPSTQLPGAKLPPPVPAAPPPPQLQAPIGISPDGDTLELAPRPQPESHAAEVSQAPAPGPTTVLAGLPLAKLGLPKLQIDPDEERAGSASSLIECVALGFGEPVVANKGGLLMYRVEARMDANIPAPIREHLEEYYADLEKNIKRAFPDCLVSLRVAVDKVVLTGNAHDLHEMAQVLRIVAPAKEDAYNTSRTAYGNPFGTQHERSAP